MDTPLIATHMLRPAKLRLRQACWIPIVTVLIACGGPRGGAAGAPPVAAPAPSPPRSSLGPRQFDAIALFRRLGLLARGAPMPFVGNISFFAAASIDSTHVLIAVSIANASLTFAREEGGFRAGYTVAASLRTGTTPVKNIEAHEYVVVSSFRETERNDESVLYEEIVTVPPGRYDFSINVRDDGSARTSADEATLVVPTLGPNTLSSPVSFARAALRSSARSLPQVIANPTASATFGRDSVLAFLLEGYGAGDSTRLVQFAVRSENGQTIYRDSTRLARRGAIYNGTITVPLVRVGIGALVLSAWAPAHSDTVRTPLFVGFGPDLPLASYEEMVNYLRWFANPADLQQLKDTPPEGRPAAWADFVNRHGGRDGSPEALRDYFSRMTDANERFKEEASPGWMTDRGKVLLGLGRPDQVYEQVSRSLVQQGRQQVWEYRGQNLNLTFYDQSGFGRWKLTATSDAEFMTAWRRRVR